MKHIFYFLTIFAILWELMVLFNCGKVHNFSKSILKKGKKTSGNKSSVNKFTTNENLFILLMLAYTCWLIVGFFTFQWFIFLGLFFISIIPKKYVWIRWLDALISLITLIFIILNAYHFKCTLF